MLGSTLSSQDSEPVGEGGSPFQLRDSYSLASTVGIPPQITWVLWLEAEGGREPAEFRPDSTLTLSLWKLHARDGTG